MKKIKTENNEEDKQAIEWIKLIVKDWDALSTEKQQNILDEMLETTKEATARLRQIEMIGNPSQEWFDKELRKARKDPRFWMERHLYRFQEAIWSFKKPTGIDKLLYRICAWSAGRLIDRCYSKHKSYARQYSKRKPSADLSVQ